MDKMSETTVEPKSFESLVAELRQLIGFPMHTGDLGLHRPLFLSGWQIIAKEFVDQLRRA
jgi:hypothetical protein